MYICFCLSIFLSVYLPLFTFHFHTRHTCFLPMLSPTHLSTHLSTYLLHTFPINVSLHLFTFPIPVCAPCSLIPFLINPYILPSFSFYLFYLISLFLHFLPLMFLHFLYFSFLSSLLLLLFCSFSLFSISLYSFLSFLFLPSSTLFIHLISISFLLPHSSHAFLFLYLHSSLSSSSHTFLCSCFMFFLTSVFPSTQSLSLSVPPGVPVLLIRPQVWRWVWCRL